MHHKTKKFEANFMSKFQFNTWESLILCFYLHTYILYGRLVKMYDLFMQLSVIKNGYLFTPCAKQTEAIPWKYLATSLRILQISPKTLVPLMVINRPCKNLEIVSILLYCSCSRNLGKDSGARLLGLKSITRLITEDCNPQLVITRCQNRAFKHD